MELQTWFLGILQINLGGKENCSVNDREASYGLEDLKGFHQIEFPIFDDMRGWFRTWYSESAFASNGIDFIPVQSNLSKSKRGVIRGIHFSDESHEQSKIITCVQGTIVDVAVDLRRNSETFGDHSKIVLSAEKGNSAYISHGLGHAFEVLSEEATVVYLLSSEWNPKLEFGLNPLDGDLNIGWQTRQPIISSKDASAQSFNEFRASCE